MKPKGPHADAFFRPGTWPPPCPEHWPRCIITLDTFFFWGITEEYYLNTLHSGSQSQSSNQAFCLFFFFFFFFAITGSPEMLRDLSRSRFTVHCIFVVGVRICIALKIILELSGAQEWIAFSFITHELLNPEVWILGTQPTAIGNVFVFGVVFVVGVELLQLLLSPFLSKPEFCPTTGLRDLKRLFYFHFFWPLGILQPFFVIKFQPLFFLSTASPLPRVLELSSAG